MIHISTLAAAAASSPTNGARSGLKPLAIALGRGLGPVGAGVVIGTIFKAVIDSVTRYPETRAEITSIQRSGLGLTEAISSYSLVAGLLAFVP